MQFRQVNKRERNRKIARYVFYGKKLLLLGLFLSFLRVGLEMLAPKVVGDILDKLLKEGIGIVNGPIFFKMLGLYLLISIGNSYFQYAGNVAFSKAAGQITDRVRRDAFSHLQKFPISYFDNLPVGTVVSRITNDSKNLQILFEMVLWQVTVALLSVAGVYIAILRINPTLALWGILPWPVFLLLMWDYKKRSAVLRKNIRDRLSDINAQTHESVTGMKILQAFGMEKRVREDFDRKNKEWLKNNTQFNKLMGWSSFNIIFLLRQLITIALLFYFGYGVITKAYPVSAGLLYILVNYSGLIFNQIQNLMQNIGNLETALTAADHIFELLNQPVPLMEEKEKIFGADVEFSHIHFAYVENEPVLKDVSFRVEAGKTLAFVGATGSGKSSVMNLLFRFYDPDEGNICIGGKDIQTVSPRELRKNMGIVLQEPYLFTGNLYSNISLNHPKISREQAKEALIAVGGGHLLDRDKGLDAEVTEKGETYSAGERQLISFARALAHNPKILVLDEATSNVDSETEQKISEAVKVLEKNRTALIIAHRLSTIRHADHIIVLDKGRIVEQGKHEELMKKHGEYYRLYQFQSRNAA